MFNTFLFSTCFSDVTFHVQVGELINKVIPAHKLLLSAKSPVFYATFRGKMAETKEHIYLPYCEYEAICELLRFLYTDEAYLSSSNVMEIFYLAEKYMVRNLIKKCTTFLEEHLDTSNVFCILKHAQFFAKEHLAKNCWYFVDKHAKDVLCCSEFLSIERSVLVELVKRETLNVREAELFHAVDCWAGRECKRQKLDVEGPVKRQILGEQVISKLRFPRMKKSEFVDSNILSKEEVKDMTKHFSSKERVFVPRRT